MSYGSAYSLVKAALVTRFTARAGLTGVNIGYSHPLDGNQVDGDAIWLDDGDGNAEVEVFTAGQTRFDENASVNVIVQSLQVDSTGTQEVADKRVDTLLYEVVAAIATDMTLGLPGANTELSVFYVSGLSIRRVTGVLDPNTATHGARAEVAVAFHSRITAT